MNQQTSVNPFQHDKLNRDEFAKNLTKVIEFDHLIKDDAYVLSLNGKYGSGKTTFIKMWKSYLEGNGYQTLYINAWTSDYTENPLFHIMSSFIEDAPLEKSVKNALKTAAAFCTKFGMAVIERKLGVELDELIDVPHVSEDLKELSKAGNEILKAYNVEKNAFNSLKLHLEKCIEQIKKKPFYIFVDELDRARPDYAIKFLEVIKHFFSIPGLVFVLAVDREQICSSIKHQYGSDADVNGYYMKFTTREANLLSENQNLINFIRSSFDFLKSKKKIVEIPSIHERFKLIERLSNMLHLTLREIETLINILASILTTSRNPNASYLFIDAAIVFIGFFLKDRKFYYDFSKLSLNQIESYLEKLDLEPQIFSILYLSTVKCENFSEFEKFKVRISSGVLKHVESLLKDSTAMNSGHTLFDEIYDHLEMWTLVFPD